MTIAVATPVPTRTAVEEAVLALVESVSPEPVQATLRSEVLADLGFDSVLVLELVAAIEDHFDVNVPLNTLPSARTVDDIVERIVQTLESRDARP